MSERYKVKDGSVPTFVTITVVDWIDLFTRPVYCKIIDDSLAYCIANKGLREHAYVYMTSHIHLIESTEKEELQHIIRDFKKHTSKTIIEAIIEIPESRREWLLNKFSYAADRIKRGKNYKVWQDGFHPVLLQTTFMLEQRIKYIHENPMELELIDHPRSWINSSYLAYEDENYVSNFELSILAR